MHSLSRGSLPLVAMFIVGWLSVLGYSYATREGSARAEEGSALEDRKYQAAPGSARRAADADADAAEAAAGVSYSKRSEASMAEGTSVTAGEAGASESVVADPLAKWKADATGDDSAARASAIISLANAPKSQALPVLQRVLTSGEPQVDRPLALNSLRTLALSQGDADGGIRNVLREAIYHGGDEATTQGAQAVLDDVEGAASKTPRNPTRQR